LVDNTVTVEPDVTSYASASTDATDATIAAGSDQPAIGSAPPPVLAEYERLRRKLGLSNQPLPLIDGRYRMETLLGRGGMGEVHLAHDERLERQVALKLVRPSIDNDPSLLQARLMREALALARVDNPNVVGIHDVGTHGGQTYLTMQFIPGANLREWQMTAGRTHAELLDAYLQAARGLAAAHGCGVVHRDFKPDNVIVGKDGLVRVLDFGIAAALQPEPNESVRVTIDDDSDSLSDGDTASLVASNVASDVTDHPAKLARMTRTGSIMGTLAYMASEQIIGGRADERTDQFAFCVALWEAIARERPFPARHPAARLENIKAGPVKGEALPRWLRGILVRGLSVDPARRWPSMGELIAELERGRSRGRKLMVGVGLALGIAVASLGGWAMAPKPAPVETCEQFMEEVDAVWTVDRRVALQELDGIDPAAIGYAIETIDSLAEGWRGRGEQLCKDGAAPFEEHPQRACMTKWLGGFERTVELLIERGDAETLARAPDLLARLVPPDGDYCALQPSQPVDSEVWSLAERARTAAVLGEVVEAERLADGAIARAQGLAAGPYTVDLAVAHAARAEVAAYTGDPEGALAEFAVTEQQALGSRFHEILLPTNVLWAKVLASSADPASGEFTLELAGQHIARAEPLLIALEIGEHDPRTAELFEARALWAKAQGRFDEAHGDSERANAKFLEAIELHRHAHGIFMEADQPTLAAKSLNNIGSRFQDLGEPEQASRAHLEAVALLERAGLPPTYRYRIEAEYNLGVLAYEAKDQSAQREGLSHFEFVAHHGNAAERLEALSVLITLAFHLEDHALVTHWTEQALAELGAQPEASAAEVVAIMQTAGIALANAGDPQGEALLLKAELRARELPLRAQFNLQRSWIAWLESVDRCDEAYARREAFVGQMIDENSDALPIGYAEWRDAGLQTSCARD
jgi:tetratricopeptide (TPR) repeat protein